MGAVITKYEKKQAILVDSHLFSLEDDYNFSYQGFAYLPGDQSNGPAGFQSRTKIICVKHNSQVSMITLLKAKFILFILTDKKNMIKLYINKSLVLRMVNPEWPGFPG